MRRLRHPTGRACTIRPVSALPSPRRRLARWLAALVLLVAFVGLARSVASLPSRRAAALHPGAEPVNWRRISPPVAALEHLLAAHRDALAQGVPVLVVARDPRGDDASFVGHWAQYLAPRADFQLAEDVGAQPAVAFVLTWGEVAPEPAWRALGREGGFALYEVAR